MKADKELELVIREEGFIPNKPLLDAILSLIDTRVRESRIDEMKRLNMNVGKQDMTDPVMDYMFDRLASLTKEGEQNE